MRTKLFLLLIGYFAAIGLHAEVFLHNENTIIIAAVNSVQADKEQANFVCSGRNDEQVLQKAIDMLSGERKLSKKGGTIVLLPGDYYIDAFNRENRNGRVAVLLPSVKSSPEVFSISVKGANHNTECSVVHLSQSGYEALESEGSYSIFACNNHVDYCHFSFTDLKITLPGGKKNIVCLDGRQMGSMECRRVKCVVENHSTWDTPTDKINLPVEGCIALCGCYFNSNSWNYVWEAVYALGFGQGFACGGEHLLCIKCVACYGKYGFTFGNYYPSDWSSRHTNTLIDCTDEANANFFKFAPNIGKQTIIIQNLNLEYWPQWFAIEGEGHYATETVPNQWNGQVNYTMNRGGSSLPNVTDHFWADGSGHNFQSRNNLHKKICSSEERRSYYPNYGQELFDTTLNKWLICIDPANKTWCDASGSVIKDE